jgi:hypothetical protein
MEHRWNVTDRGKPKYSGEKPVPVPLCPPQIPYGLTWDRTRASAVSGRRVSAWTMAGPLKPIESTLHLHILFQIRSYYCLFHLRWCLQSGSFLHVLLLKFPMYFLCHTCVLHAFHLTVLDFVDAWFKCHRAAELWPETLLWRKWIRTNSILAKCQSVCTLILTTFSCHIKVAVKKQEWKLYRLWQHRVTQVFSFLLSLL